jgi:hypothetical protein
MELNEMRYVIVEGGNRRNDSRDIERNYNRIVRLVRGKVRGGRVPDDFWKRFEDIDYDDLMSGISSDMSVDEIVEFVYSWGSGEHPRVGSDVEDVEDVEEVIGFVPPMKGINECDVVPFQDGSAKPMSQGVEGNPVFVQPKGGSRLGRDFSQRRG